MRKTIRLLALLCFVLSGIAILPLKKKSSHQTPERSAKYDNMQQLMEREFRLTRDPRLNRVPRERLLIAQEVRNAKLANMEAAMAVPGINWTERGPNNVGGRTRALWFDLNDAPNYNKVWAAGVSGGLWVTNDISAATPVWTRVDDFFDNLAITCFAQDPADPDIMYFGTGEGWFNVDAVQGFGIWKSVDGGGSWTRLTSTANFLFVQDLLIDNNGNVYATLRSSTSGAGALGVQQSTDGGNSWTQVLGAPVFGSSSRGADLELAANGDIYASLGAGNSNGGVYRSPGGVNAGNAGTWVNITPNGAGTVTAPSNFWNRIELACAPSNSDVVYALFQGFSNVNCTSIQRYSVAAGSWTVGTVPTIIDQGANSVFTRSQAFYDLIAAVDPNDAFSLYIGGIDALRSDDGGANWTQMTTWSLFGAAGFTPAQNVHADHHAIVYTPGSSSRVLWGTDGGIYLTTNADVTGAGSKPSFTNKNSGYNVTQYYGVAIHPVTIDYFLAGAQDNGSHIFETAGMGSVSEASGGDGGFSHIDQDDGDIQITSYVFNNYFVSTNGGLSFTTRSKNNRGDFINPTDYDNTADILYGGDDDGFYFRWTSPATNGANAQVSVTNFAGGFISHVAVSPITANRVYFGLDNGSVVMVDDAHTGAAKTGEIIKPAIPGIVSCIAIDPADENHMLVTYSNYGVTQVWESTNALSGSPTWTATDGDLPDMPVRWALFDPRNADWALLATELGVWSTNDLNGAGTAWSPTNSGLANVRVDMLQYRAGDRTIAAATHGRGLFTSVVPDVTTPDVNFQSATTAATEQNTATVDCRNYHDYSVVMTIANPPTGDATITVNIEAGNTATQGLDFDYTTNGDFVSPSNSFIFADGLSTPHTITVRVYDDAEIEAAESFTFSYAITGATDAQTGAGAQTHTFTINSDDQAPITGGNFTIGTNAFGLGTPSVLRSNEPKHRVQTLFTAAELNAAGLNASAYINAMVIEVATKNSTKPYNGFTISIANTTATSLSTGFITPAFQQVYSDNYSSVAGDNTFTFSTPFLWDGSSNIVVQFCFDNSPAAADAAADIMFGDAEPLGTGVIASTYSDFDGEVAAGCSMVAEWIAPSRIKATFVAGSSPVASALNTSRSEYLGPNSDVYFYSGTGELLARVRNLTAHDYGCTQVVIDRDGTASTQFWNTTPSQYLMDKTFRVLPANNNPAGQFEITFYFTEDEVNGWEAATGQSFNAIQMIKIPSQVLNVTPATPEPDGPGTVQIVDPTRGTLGTHSTLTFTFVNGFSGFGAGIPGSSLPVTLLEFKGRLHNNTALLTWKTATEQNSMGFEVEKSDDGITFRKIGYVAAAGNSSSVRNYAFNDQDLARENNYYRLKQVDKDGRYLHSKVILLKYDRTAITQIRILRNPVKENVDFEFDGIPDGSVTIKLTDVNGRILKSWQNQYVMQSRMRIYVGNLQLAGGVYLLIVQVNGKNFTERIFKE